MAEKLSGDNSQSIRFAEHCVPTPYGKVFFRSNQGIDAAHPEINLVLVHGMIVSGSYMMPLARRLAHLCRVYVPDFPGYGKSEKQPSILGIPDMADALEAWMDSCGIDKATLVANSFGCQVAAEFAARHPERVERLVLQGPTVDPSARGLFRQAFRLKLNSWRESKSVGMISAHDYKKAGLRRVLKTTSITLHDHLEEKLPRIQAPVLVVRGDRDPVVPQRWAEEVTRMLPHAELNVIPGAAHTLNYSEPDKFAAAIRSFLKI